MRRPELRRFVLSAIPEPVMSVDHRSWADSGLLRQPRFFRSAQYSGLSRCATTSSPKRAHTLVPFRYVARRSRTIYDRSHTTGGGICRVVTGSSINGCLSAHPKGPSPLLAAFIGCHRLPLCVSTHGSLGGADWLSNFSKKRCALLEL